jgi:hypothetical protein
MELIASESLLLFDLSLQHVPPQNYYKLLRPACCPQFGFFITSLALASTIRQVSEGDLLGLRP